MRPIEADAIILETGRDQFGNEIPVLIPSKEQHEILKMLDSSPAWKLYRLMLIQAKEAKLRSILGSNDPNQVMKTIGEVAGLNFTINQLGILVAQHNKKVKSVDSETTNYPYAEG